MSTLVNMHQAKSTLSQLVQRAEGGEEIILARSGRPVAKIVPFSEPTRGSVFGALKGHIPDISVEEWAESDKDLATLWKS